MTKLQVKINFGSESLDSLISEIIKNKIKEVTQMQKNVDLKAYNKNENYQEINIEQKMDESK